MKLFSITVISAFFAQSFFLTTAFAAACCGGSVAFPALITGDQKMLTSISFLDSTLKTDVDADGVWSDRNSRDTISGFTLDYAHQLKTSSDSRTDNANSDNSLSENSHWQYAFHIPYAEITSHGLVNNTLRGLQDTSVALGYIDAWKFKNEPEDAWPMRQVYFTELILPTGTPIEKALDQGAPAGLGRGFAGLGIGTLLSKPLSPFDIGMQLELHKSFSRKISVSTGDIELTPGWGHQIGVIGGYSWNSYRFGFAVTDNYEDAIQSSGAVTGSGSLQRSTTTGISIAQFADEFWMWSLNYSNQKWFGNPLNTTLTESLTITAQYRLN